MPPQPTVQWRLMFRVADRAAFDACLARVLPLLGSGSVIGEGLAYWKMPELWESSVSVPLAGASPGEQVLECLMAALRLGSGWHILGSLSAESADGFSGVFAIWHNAAVSHVAGLEWASFDVVESASAALPVDDVEML